MVGLRKKQRKPTQWTMVGTYCPYQYSDDGCFHTRSRVFDHAYIHLPTKKAQAKSIMTDHGVNSSSTTSLH